MREPHQEVVLDWNWCNLQKPDVLYLSGPGQPVGGRSAAVYDQPRGAVLRSRYPLIWSIPLEKN